MTDDRDAAFMRRALELAERGRGRVEPNPRVGAVVVRGEHIVGEGWHAEFGSDHAEVAALHSAGDAARGSTVYVTLEPCAHHGKTPPCSDALVRAGVARVVFAASDPTGLARGGASALRDAGIEVASGVLEERARDLNPAFFHAAGPAGAERPWVELKLALSLDARVADADGRSAWITGEQAREEVHRIRAGHDAIAVGVGTVVADDPLLTVRGPISPRRPPVRIVFDRRLDTSPGARLLATAGEAPVLVIAAPDAAADRRRELQATGARVELARGLREALNLLRESGIGSLLVEGGARIASALLTSDLVDRLTLFYAPILLGPEAVSPFAGIRSPPLAEVHRWRHVRTRVFAPDTLVELERAR